MPPMRTDDEMSVQEPETTHVSVAHPSTSQTIPSDVPVASVEPEDLVPTTPPRRLLFKRLEPPKRTRFFFHSCSDGVNDKRHRVQRWSVTTRRQEQIPC